MGWNSGPLRVSIFIILFRSLLLQVSTIFEALLQPLSPYIGVAHRLSHSRGPPKRLIFYLFLASNLQKQGLESIAGQKAMLMIFFKFFEALFITKNFGLKYALLQKK